MYRYLLILLLLVIPIVVLAIPPYSPPSSRDKNPLGNISGGLGAGFMYGGLGANLEYRIDPQISATAGIGLDGQGEWVVGGRYYFKPEGAGARGRVTAAIGAFDENVRLLPQQDRGSVKAVIAIGWSWANADTDYKGWDVDVTTEGRVSVGYHF